MLTEQWRELDLADRWQFQEWLRNALSARRRKGEVKYHVGEKIPMFKGDPLEQAIE